MSISASNIASSSTLNELRTQFNNLVTDVSAIEGGTISYTTLNTTNTNTTILNVKEDGTIVFEGASDDAYETTLTVVDPTADRTITFPNETGTVHTSGGDTTHTNIIIGDAGTIGSASSTSAITIASTGIVTLVDDLLIKDGGTIGSASSATAMTISSGGIVTFVDDILIKDGGTIGSASSTSAITVASTGIVSFIDDILIKDGGTIGSASSTGAITVASTGIVTLVDDLILKDAATIGVTSSTSAISIASTGIVTFVDDILIKDAGTIGSASDPDAISISSGGVVNISATTANTSASDGALTVAGGAGIAADLTVGDDLRLITDASVLSFGANSEIALTHVHDTGLLLTDSGGSPTLQLHDTGESLSSDGSKLILTSNSVAFNFPNADGTDGQVLKTDGSGTLSFITASANTPSSADGQALGSASLEWSDLFLADASTIQFGNDQEIKLTHVADTGLLLTDSGGGPTLQFHDANEAISSDGGHLIFTSNGVTFDFPSADGSDGQVLKTDGSGVLSFVTASANTPSSADGQALGSASLEWSDLFLADGSTIQFGNDQEVILTHVADVGLKLSHEATGDNLPIVLNLESEEDDIVSGEEIGRIDFTAGDSGGTDAITTAASIAATAEDTFASDNNSTGLAFKLGVSAAATEMFRMTHDGDFKVITDGSALGFGANNEIELTHVHNVGLLLTDSGGTPTLQLHDANESVSSDGSNLFLTSGGTAYSLTATDGSDGHFLKTDGSGALTFAAASVSDLACDNLSVGDAAVVISTSSGNITLDATANDSDIIFKGTDGTADTTFLTIDGSDAGKLLPNNGMDLNGKELILDADADTSITADTDDTIDIRIAGADDFQITANSFNALSGSSIVVDSGATLSIPSGGVISGPGFVGKVLVFSGIFGS